MTQKSTKSKGDGLSDARVTAYLRDNPDFLARNPDVLRLLAAPDRELGDGIFDMQTAMIGQLRSEVTRLKARQDDIVLTTRANLSTQARVHECVLAILAAKSFEQAIQIITTDFAVTLDLDIVTLCVETEADAAVPVKTPGLRVLSPGTVEATVGENRKVLLHADTTGDPEIFGGGASLVQSAAFIRLDIAESTPPALVAFGARRPGKFHAEQGTELLQFLGRVVERSIRIWLGVPF
ncbi:MAG: DUF484 family protein [Alphaproteobacteria bacterium]